MTRAAPSEVISDRCAQIYFTEHADGYVTVRLYVRGDVIKSEKHFGMIDAQLAAVDMLGFPLTLAWHKAGRP